MWMCLAFILMEEVTKLWVVDFIAVRDECSQCGICAEECPVGAVDAENSRLIDTENCVTCCAFIKTARKVPCR